MDENEKRILETIDAQSERLIAFAQDIYTHPEAGFKEVRTAGKVAEVFRELNLPFQEGLALTGVKARMDCPADGKAVTVAAIGELDGIMCQSHPDADPETGLTHACGHNLQLTALVGAALALSQPEIRNALCGNVVFFAVPSEEFTDIDFKSKLMAKGLIGYGGGKSELIRLGAFDDINICVNHHLHMVHTHSDLLLGNNTTNGFVVKKIRFIGRASHAAISPEKGINALNAATIGLNALPFQRETYRDTDHVRVHSVIIKGGDMVNVVPDDVVVETQVRAKYMSAMQDACRKTNRAFEAGAHAVGARIEIKDFPGYLPILESPIPKALLDAGSAVAGKVKVSRADPLVHNPASTDVGDLTHILPVVGFTTGGFKGSLHGADFQITDPYLAYVLPAKVMALTIYSMLKEGAKGAHEILERFPHHLSKQEYLEYMDSFNK